MIAKRVLIQDISKNILALVLLLKVRHNVETDRCNETRESHRELPVLDEVLCRSFVLSNSTLIAL
jgi:hypothetical protein